MDAPTIAWLGDSTDFTPGFDFNLGEPGNALDGDILHSEYSVDGSSWSDYIDHELTVSDLVDLVISETGTVLHRGTFQFRARLERGSDVSDWSNSEIVTLVRPAGGFKHDPDIFEKQPKPFSRKYFNDLKAAEAAQLAAQERADRLKSRQARQTLNRAAQEAAEAIAHAKENEVELSRMTAALEAARSASDLAETIRQADLAIQYAREIQEEDEAIALLMLH